MGSIETALIDLIGKKTNLPAYKLLGIVNKRIQCYYSGGSVVMSPKEIEKTLKLRYHKNLNTTKCVLVIKNGHMILFG